MSKEIQKIEDKYLVMKWTDIIGCLSIDQLHAFTTLLLTIRNEKASRGLAEHEYIVCNQDEPYAEMVWQMILDGERAKLEQEKTK